MPSASGILETLWSNLDEVAGLIQAMSIAHGQEVLDAYMNDNNWWKIIQMRMHLNITHVIGSS